MTHTAGDRELANISNAFLGTISINGKKKISEFDKAHCSLQGWYRPCDKTFLGPVK